MTSNENHALRRRNT